MANPEFDPYEIYDGPESEEDFEAMAEDDEAERLLEARVDYIVDTQNIPYGEAWRKVGRPSPIYEAMANGTFKLPNVTVLSNHLELVTESDEPEAETTDPAAPVKKARRKRAKKPNPARITNFVEAPEAGPSVERADAIDAFETIFEYYNRKNRRLGAEAVRFSPFPRQYGNDTDDVITNMAGRVDGARADANRALNVLVNPVGLTDLGMSQFDIEDTRADVAKWVKDNYGPVVKDTYGNVIKGYYADHRRSALGKMKTSLKRAEKKKNS